MVKHLFYAAWNTSPCRTSARQGGERSGPCRDVRVTDLCEVKGDVTIPESKTQHYGAHFPSKVFGRRMSGSPGKIGMQTSQARRRTAPSGTSLQTGRRTRTQSERGETDEEQAPEAFRSRPMKTVEMTLKRSVETDSLSGKKKEKDNTAETSLV